MPTSLPTATASTLYSARFTDRTELPPVTGAIFLVAIWAIAMLLFTAIAHVGAAPGDVESFQFLANF